MMVRAKPRREDLGPGENLCDYCTGKCCRYFALPIETPETRDDFDHIRWYMMHGSVSVFVDDEVWYLMIHQECKHLQDDYRCGIYEDRPNICREYSTDNCEYDDDETCYEKLFESPEQLWEYAQAILPKPKRRKTRQEISLPVVS